MEGRKGLVTLIIFSGQKIKEGRFLESLITKRKTWKRAALHRNLGGGLGKKAWELAAFAYPLFGVS
jgi:hypothetical protein